MAEVTPYRKRSVYDYFTPQNIRTAVNYARAARNLYSQFKSTGKKPMPNFHKSTGGDPTTVTLSRYRTRRPIGAGPKFNSNKRRKIVRDGLNLKFLKNMICPRWTLNTHNSTPIIKGQAGLQTYREHTYMTSKWINQFIAKSRDVYTVNGTAATPLSLTTVAATAGAGQGMSALVTNDAPGSVNGVTDTTTLSPSISVKCCMLSYRIQEFFHNTSTTTIYLRLLEVAPKQAMLQTASDGTAQASTFYNAWQLAVLEQAPIRNDIPLYYQPTILGPDTVSNDVGVKVDSAISGTVSEGTAVGNTSLGTGLAAGAISGANDIDKILLPRALPRWDSLVMTQKWRFVRSKLVKIMPGDTYIHNMDFKPFCIDSAWHNQFAEVSPFRSRKLIVMAWGEPASVEEAGCEFGVAAPFQITRSNKHFGSFRAVPFQKNITKVNIGSGTSNPTLLPAFSSTSNQTAGTVISNANIRVCDELDNDFEAVKFGDTTA